MIKVITYGTYDLLHKGHINLLRKAKELGDYLIVGVTSDTFDKSRGKNNVSQTLLERIESIKSTGLADEIIIEDYLGQKIDDIQTFNVDIFAIGSDWLGKFDYLKEYCEVVYIERTKGVSSTEIRKSLQKNYRLGIIGTGRIASKFCKEVTFVYGITLKAAYNPVDISQGVEFADTFNLEFCHDSFSGFLKNIDCVYIASPHLTHYEYAKTALLTGKHVLCEIPLTLEEVHSKELYSLANKKRLVLLEASKTAFSPGFLQLINIVKSGIIGKVVDVQASLSKLQNKSLREFDFKQAGGSMTELGPLPILVIIKLLGADFKALKFYSKFESQIDVFTKGVFVFDNSIGTITLGLGVKTEGDLVISGTLGYIYVPSPWWKTEYFEVRFENQSENRKFFYRYEGEGLRYEIQEFISMIENKRLTSFKFKPEDSVLITKIIEGFRKGENVEKI